MAGSTLGSVTNAVRVLKAFSAVQREWGVTDLARHLDLGKSTVHRLLSTLTEESMLEQDPATGRYRLGLIMFDLAAAVPKQLDLHEAVLSPMTDLRNRTGEAVQVAVLDGREVVYVERIDSPQTLRMFLEIGRRNWANCSATGKVLLGQLPGHQLDQVLNEWKPVRRTPHSITSISKLRAEIDLARTHGYAENRQESELGVASIAAPIRDIAGNAVAGLSVAGPIERIDAIRHELIDATMRTAGLVSRRLGHRGAA